MCRNRWHRIFFSLPALLALLCTGCIKDDGECGPARDGVTLAFRYDYHTGTEDLFSREVNTVDIYAYDAGGVLILSQTVPVSEMGAGNNVKLDLGDGDYTFVVWGNFSPVHFSYHMSQSRLATSSLAVNAADDGSVEIHSASLFHGTATARVEGGSATVPVSMVKNTKQVKIYVVGKEAPQGRSDADTGLKIRIEGSNGRYDFMNRPVECEPLTYLPRYTRINGEVLCAEMTVMRLFTADDVVLNITDTNNPGKPVLYTGRLTDVIFSKISEVSSDEDLDRRDLFELTFLLERYLDGTWALTGIYSGDWTNIDSNEGV